METLRFIIPRFKLLPKRMAELPFHGTVAASATLLVSSSRIFYPFKVVQAKMTFTEEANNLVQHSWYVTSSGAVTGTGAPPGINIFGRESPQAFFAGKSTVKKIDMNLEYPEGGLFIVLYTVNGCTYAYYVDASITIQAL